MSDVVLRVLAIQAIRNRRDYNLDYDACSWGIERIARTCKMSESQVVVDLAHYEDEGSIRIEEREGTTNRYFITFIPPAFRELVLENDWSIDADGSIWSI